MSAEPVSAYAYQMAQMRISQLELENKMLKEQLREYELKKGAFNAPMPPPPVAAPAMVIDNQGDDVLRELRTKAMAEREAASAKFLALMGNYQKLLSDGSDEDMSTEDSFSLPSSPLNTLDTDLSMDSPISTPLNTQ